MKYYRKKYGLCCDLVHDEMWRFWYLLSMKSGLSTPPCLHSLGPSRLAKACQRGGPGKPQADPLCRTHQWTVQGELRRLWIHPGPPEPGGHPWEGHWSAGTLWWRRLMTPFHSWCTLLQWHTHVPHVCPGQIGFYRALTQFYTDNTPIISFPNLVAQTSFWCSSLPL